MTAGRRVGAHRRPADGGRVPAPSHLADSRNGPATRRTTPPLPAHRLVARRTFVRSTTAPFSLLAGGALLLTGSLLSAFGLVLADWRAIGPFGLVEALPVVYFVGLVLVCAAAGVSVASPSRAHGGLAVACAVVLVVVLHIAPSVVEPLPRFNTAWLHVGFSDHVAATGRPAPRLDARFSWPAFFGLSAAVQDALHLDSALPLLRYWPVVMNLLYLPLVHQLVLRLTVDERAGRVGLLAFPTLNWVGQDYYSPQSVALLLLLGIVLATLLFFPASGSLVGRWVGPAPDALASGRDRAIPYVLILLMSSALIVEHQLTPIAAFLMLLALAATRRTGLTLLPVWFGLVLLVWVSFGATAYWQGHLSDIFGGFGQVTGNVARGGSQRLGGTEEHTLVVNVRLVFSVVVWCLAGAGIALGRGWGRLTCAALFGAPFLVLAGQSYGGEGTIRVYLYALPAACAAVAALSARVRRSDVRGVVVGGFLVLTLPAFLLSRWGNESFEQTRPNELAAVQVLYRAAPEGSTLASLRPQLPWRYQSATDYRYKSGNLDAFATGDLPALRARLGDNPAGTYVIITTGQLLFGEEVRELPEGWSRQTEAALRATGEFRLLYSNPDARIYAYQPLARARATS